MRSGIGDKVVIPYWCINYVDSADLYFSVVFLFYCPYLFTFNTEA